MPATEIFSSLPRIKLTTLLHLSHLPCSAVPCRTPTILHAAPICFLFARVSPTRLLTQTKRTFWVLSAPFWLLWRLSSLDRPWISQLIASVTGTLLRLLPLVLPLRCVYAYITYITSTSSSVRLSLPIIVNLRPHSVFYIATYLP
ncbi:uncharacterized protein BDW70DRAFT_26603 [Aspergillus foveolatus]|uniref:uncharacterized protein n=1 Tax=Aspergillus foveolatus TaxID=210207 RepID=UPI003CCD2144